MRTFLLICLTLLVTLLSSCHRHSHNKLQEKGKYQTCLLNCLHQIDSLDHLHEFDLDIAKECVEKAEEFCSLYPEDPLSADFLYKSALMAMMVAKMSDDFHETVNYSRKALSIFDEIIRIYPDFYGIKNCIFNKGVIYEVILHDYKSAEALYREYIAQFPSDSSAANSNSFLQYIGKTPDEIFDELK